MDTGPYLSLILPAYNEAATMPHTLRKVQTYLNGQPYSYEILVAADGNDGTREIVAAAAAQDHRIHTLGGPTRSGKGCGIRQAVGRSRGDLIGFIDADYKTPIEEFEKILPWFARGFDLVIGSRAMSDSRIEVPAPLHRRVGSRGFALAMHLMVGLWDVSDTQCGFKFFRGPVARDLFGQQRIDGYMFDVEILYLARRRGYRIKEVGVAWRDDGDSRLDLVAGNWRNMLDLFRIRFNGKRESGPSDQRLAA
jgi:dolichyl-phosphate beta-glucosyltransferase